MPLISKPRITANQCWCLQELFRGFLRRPTLPQQTCNSSSSQSSWNQKNFRFGEVIVVLYAIKTSFPCQLESGALNSPTSTRRHVTIDPLCQVFSVVSLLLRRDKFVKSQDVFTPSDHLKNISMNISQVKNALEAFSQVMTTCCQSGICKFVSRIFDKNSKLEQAQCECDHWRDDKDEGRHKWKANPRYVRSE